MKSFIKICILAVSLVSVQSSFSNEMEAPVVITNATIYTMGTEGIIEDGSLVIINNKIAAMGKNIPLPMGVKFFDVKGGSITPGLFNSNTHIGIEEVSAIKATNDFETTNPDITASLKVADAFNPHSVIIPHNRTHGLVRALVMPESGSSLIAGQAAIVDLSGSFNSVIDDYAALVVNLGERGKALSGGSRAASYRELRNLLEEAREYAQNKQFYLRGQTRRLKLSKADLEAMQVVINQQKPVIIRVHRAVDILQTLKLAKQEKIRVILAGVEEGWMVKKQLAEAGVVVIIEPVDNLPSSYEALGTRLENAKLLQQAGVKLLFTGMGWQNTHNAYLVRQSAGNAVANGLSRVQALAAITRTPADVFGMSDYGELKVGATANMVVWQGDPLEVTSEAVKVFINGKEIPMQSRSLRLRDRYYNRLKSNLDLSQ